MTAQTAGLPRRKRLSVKPGGRGAGVGRPRQLSLNPLEPLLRLILLAQPGVGPKTIRALALVAEVIYGAKPSYEDPARYSFAHGGKDATPYPVDRDTYDRTIATIRALCSAARASRPAPQTGSCAARAPGSRRSARET